MTPKVGAVVGLRQPFMPNDCNARLFHFGQVVAVVMAGGETTVLVYLCNRQGCCLYTDERQEPILYGFCLEEVECLGITPQDAV